MSTEVPRPDDPQVPAAPGSPAPPIPAFPIVGVGASAGGLEAVTLLLRHLPAETGMAFVVVQHLDPHHESNLVELLRRTTPLRVCQIAGGAGLERDHVYVIPPNANLRIEQGRFVLSSRGGAPGQHMPIDGFFRSLAEDVKSLAIGVILSGTGSDGTQGLKAIKEANGITFAQDDTAKHTGMPRSAVAAECVDWILPPEQMAQELMKIAQHPLVKSSPVDAVEQTSAEDENELGRVLRLLRKTSGVDFTHYKRSTIQRRLRRRMLLQKMDSLEVYLQVLQDNPAEVEALYQDILVHVTGFFRDPETFEALKSVAFPRLLQNRSSGAPIRVWVPACSTGEEAYSLVMCLLEFLGDRASHTPIKLFATDISEKAINQARAGVYRENITADMTPERLRRFFLKADTGYQIHKAIRELCVFARQDITRDPPFSQLDFISCRNALIYMDVILQKRVLPLFHYALKLDGFLLLGNSETIGTFSDLFTVIDGKHKLYAKKLAPGRPALEFAHHEHAASATSMDVPPSPGFRSELDVQHEADRVILAKYAPAGVVINEDMQIIQFRGKTGLFLEPAPGTASFNLLKMAREGLMLELRTLTEAAKKSGAAVRKEGIRVKTNGHLCEISVEVTPFSVPPSGQRFYVVLFAEAAHPAAAPSQDLPAAAAVPPPGAGPADQQQAGQLRQELAATKEYLQSLIDQLETSNEELKAANEEIISSNEELQSTNEELQTAKEELQATNEELSTVNDELRHRNLEAAQLNDDLTNLLTSVQIPIVMLGRDLCIRRFTPSAGRVLHLIPGDIGRPISDIKPKINVPDFEGLVSEVVDTFASKEFEVQDQEGHWYVLSIRPYETLDKKIDGAVITFQDIDAIKRGELALRLSEARFRAIVDSAAEGIFTIDEHGDMQSFNAAAEAMFGYAAAEITGKNLSLLIPSLAGDAGENSLANLVIRKERSASGVGLEMPGRRKDGRRFPLEVTASEVPGTHGLMIGLVRDLTALQEAQGRVLQAEGLAAIGKMSAGLAHESRNALQRSQACLEMLLRELQDRPAARDLIAKLQKSQDDLLHLYESVREYSAPLKLQRTACRLDTMLCEAWDQLGAMRTGRKVDFHADAGTLDVGCEIDPGCMKQVFKNILENSLATCRDPVLIDVTWSEAKLDGRPALRISLRNNGPPFTPEERRRIFDAFFTTRTHGSGLGMAIVQRIVQAHGGRIAAGAGAGQGAEIVITLPRGPA